MGDFNPVWNDFIKAVRDKMPVDMTVEKIKRGREILGMQEKT